jgi:hypothetical protein
MIDEFKEWKPSYKDGDLFSGFIPPNIFRRKFEDFSIETLVVRFPQVRTSLIEQGLCPSNEELWPALDNFLFQVHLWWKEVVKINGWTPQTEQILSHIYNGIIRKI